MTEEQNDLIRKYDYNNVSKNDLHKRVCGEGVNDNELREVSVFMRRMEAKRIKLIGVSRREWSVM